MSRKNHVLRIINLEAPKFVEHLRLYREKTAQHGPIYGLYAFGQPTSLLFEVGAAQMQKIKRGKGKLTVRTERVR